MERVVGQGEVYQAKEFTANKEKHHCQHLVESSGVLLLVQRLDAALDV